MSTTIPCPRCGHENTLGTLFCASCGQRLDLTGADGGAGLPEVIRQARLRRQRKARRKKIAWTVFGVLLVVVILCPLLAAWRPALPEARDSRAQAYRYLSSRRWAVQLLQRGQGAALSIREADLNSYMIQRCRQENSPPAAVRFDEKGATVFLVERILGVEMVSALRWIPLESPGSEPAFRLGGASIGHLPVPPPFRRFLRDRVHRTIGGVFSAELQLLPYCVEAKIPHPGLLHMKLSPRRGKTATAS